MRTPASAVALAAALAFTVPFVAQARADEPSASILEMAQHLVEEGRALGKDGRWADALERFRRTEGGALLVTGGVFYVMARSAISPVTSACRSGGSCAVPPGSPLPGDHDDAHSKQTIAIGLASAGAAAAVAGVVLLATVGSGASSPATTARVAPWAAPGGGGATLVGVL